LSVNTGFPHNIFQNYGPLELHYYVQRFYSTGTCFIQLLNFPLIYKSYAISSPLHQISPHLIKTTQAR